MRSGSEFVIPFVGLKTGVHTYEFDIDDSFFDSFEYSIIRSADVHVILDLEKKETMLIGNFSLSGSVHALCDRCNEPAEIPIKGSYQLIYKFDDEPSNDESLVIVSPEANEIDVSANILELVNVSLPARLMHEEGECDEQMLDLLEEYSGYQEKLDNDGEDEEIDPRWDKLKNLK